jgi:hypothetical protein
MVTVTVTPESMRRGRAVRMFPVNAMEVGPVTVRVSPGRRVWLVASA